MMMDRTSGKVTYCEMFGHILNPHLSARNVLLKGEGDERGGRGGGGTREGVRRGRGRARGGREEGRGGERERISLIHWALQERIGPGNKARERWDG